MVTQPTIPIHQKLLDGLYSAPPPPLQPTEQEQSTNQLIKLHHFRSGTWLCRHLQTWSPLASCGGLHLQLAEWLTCGKCPDSYCLEIGQYLKESYSVSACACMHVTAVLGHVSTHYKSTYGISLKNFTPHRICKQRSLSTPHRTTNMAKN